MNKMRLSLDDPVFAGRLRQSSRNSSYVVRPTPQPMKTLQEVELRTDDLAALQSPEVKLQHEQKIHTFIAATAHAVVPQTTQQDSIIPAGKDDTKQSFTPWLQHPPISPWQSAASPQTSLEAPIIKKKLFQRKQSFALYAMAAVVFVIGLTVSLNGLRANRQVSAQVQRLTVQSSKVDSDDNGSSPSVQKPSSANISDYVVAPNLPRYVDIAKLGVHARILSMGVTSKNQLKAPGNVYDAGWYNASAQPGQPGGMLLDGHISSWTTKGVFYGLSKLINGDQITITRGDGQKFTYVVVKKQLFDADKVDMASMLVSQNSTKPGLNLISCSGEVIPGTNEFNKRMVIYAVME